jgi:predicted dehydrogenase
MAAVTASESRWSKIFSFIRLYGVGRTLYKVAGRLRSADSLGRLIMKPSGKRDIAVVGCGQFAFATIGYFISRRFGRRFAQCYDPMASAAQSFARFYGLAAPAASATEALHAPDVQLVYIASNHSTHASYAIEALTAGKVVYVEKPVAVNMDQLRDLARAIRATNGKIYAGYNRPYSAAVRQLREYARDLPGPLTLACFISGHQLETDHWYRAPSEGTRICGNVGHWLDLAVHLLSWGQLPDRWRIALAWSNDSSRDDDLAISLTSERGDLISIVLTARTEPFEGINETINFQWGEVIAKIDDFRRLEVWRGAERKLHKYWPKDVGHRRAILQPFETQSRPWTEIELSSLLMLQIARMVVQGERDNEFSFRAHAALLDGAA